MCNAETHAHVSTTQQSRLFRHESPLHVVQLQSEQEHHLCTIQNLNSRFNRCTLPMRFPAAIPGVASGICLDRSRQAHQAGGAINHGPQGY